MSAGEISDLRMNRLLRLGWLLAERNRRHRYDAATHRNVWHTKYRRLPHSQRLLVGLATRMEDEAHWSSTMIEGGAVTGEKVRSVTLPVRTL